MQDRRRGWRAAFTLLELILAMTIVSMLVLMIANMYQEISQAWSLGTRGADMNIAGRAAVEFIAGELEQAVAGPIEAVSPPNPAIPFQLMAGQELKFVVLDAANTNGRALRSALFRYDPDEKSLKYWRQTDTFDPYRQVPAWDSSVTLVDNVYDCYFLAYPSTQALTTAAGLSDYDSALSIHSNRLPACVDIYVKVLALEDVAKFEGGGGAEFLERNCQRYSTRVYFKNRLGYAGRP